jgi:hypothetical protein
LPGDFLSSRYEGTIVGMAIAPAVPIAALLMKSLLLKIINSDYMVLKCVSGYFHSSIKIKQYCCMKKRWLEKLCKNCWHFQMSEDTRLLVRR